MKKYVPLKWRSSATSQTIHIVEMRCDSQSMPVVPKLYLLGVCDLFYPWLVQVLDMERQVLNQLHFEVTGPTTKTFLR
jgi:hypothetical protein